MVLHAVIRSVSGAPGLLLIVSALGLCGCAVVGPRSITAGRGVYAEVINSTEDEQILNVIVRQRYDQTFGMMSVASVTANLSLKARAGTNIGFGSSADYAGNLVPFSAGVAYEENPTISYVPLSGEDFQRRMLMSVTVGEWHLLSSNAAHPGRVLDVAARRVNGLRNPLPGEAPRSPEFDRFVELYDRLRRAAVLDPVRTHDAPTEDDFSWYFHDYAEGHEESVREILDLLGVMVQPDGSPILLPLRQAVGRSDSAIHVQPRSALDVLRAFGAGVEIPASHLEDGIVEPHAWAVSEQQQFITIRSSEDRPDDALTRIRFRDHWFYIDAADTPSKRAFAFLRTFIGMRLADPALAQRAPVLTLPAN